MVAGLDLTHTSSTKPLINLGLGDPTVFNLHPPSEASISAVQEALLSGGANGYVPGTGDRAACAAVARYHQKWDGVSYQAEDVTLVSTTIAIAYPIRSSLFGADRYCCDATLVSRRDSRPRHVFLDYDLSWAQRPHPLARLPRLRDLAREHSRLRDQDIRMSAGQGVGVRCRTDGEFGRRQDFVCVDCESPKWPDGLGE